ncbi:hypothetical protein HHI36_007138 [Cryptolaemus montrouzieri]|uniref:CUB domain-containing protein n=1 Tax=Cryptolaemus montrouzieri TaxID=559131 RepID=A0ABD2MNP7_9CUCU
MGRFKFQCDLPLSGFDLYLRTTNDTINMLEVFQMFSFILKSKNRRNLYVSLTCCAIVILDIGSVVYGKCQDNNCGGNGVCKNNSCVCYDGWQGPQCQYCAGKVRLGGPTGTIHDGLGNYSISTKCSWLIDAPNSSIILHLEEFEIECGWDYVYIFDGDSVESPLLAVFSGLMYKNGYNIRRIPEVVANSGAALIHFYSDDASSMSGFNISYRLNACPSKVSGVDCSGNGVCSGRKCTCNSFWTGKACHFQQCPNSCGEAKGRGRCDGHGCKCNPGYKGNDCSQLAVNGYWETVSVSSFNPPGSASHGAVVWKDSMYLVAGESYGRGSMLYVYDFNGNMWKKPDTNSQSPSPRYGQSTVVYGDKIYMYGGVLGNLGSTSELWSYDIGAETWENITVKPSSCNDDSYLMCGLLKLAGHTATVVTNIDNKKADKMVVIFGHSPSFGYVNIVQEFYFEEREWHIVNTTGYPVKGGYGHTASWDPLSTKIYVYGGVVSRSESSQELNRNLYSYEPNSKTWTLLTDAPSSRFLHSASFITPGLMLVFGGNTLNDPSNSFDGKCYSSELLAYDVTCDSWHVLEVPADLQSDLPRFGHSAVVFESSLYIYGGFAGQMLSDMLKYTPGQCSQFHTADVCLNVNIGAKCIWNVNTTRCENIQTMMPRIEQPASGESVKCPDLNRSSMRHRMLENTKRCSSFEDCSSCTHTTSDCVWCGNMCAYKECTSIETLSSVRSIDECPSASGLQCHLLLTCSACNKHPDCRYNTKCVPRHANNFRAFFIPGGQCRVCSELNSCMDCTMSECIWCHNEGRCVDKNAYTASFPYGQCREWTTVQNKCRSKETDEKSQCSFYSTCVQCRDDPACGWCDDGSRTGLGMCMPGGFAGPTFHTESLTSTTCLPDKWHFTTCPKCQCNGHAICKDNTTICEPCGNFAMGDHCEHCMKGYWGNPINGGKCIPCECNNHATHCHPETGKCFCTIKGLKGDHCDTCDSMNHYYKDDYNNGSCYYDLTVDYQFTFNLSKKEERHYTQINFKNSPIKSDIDADFAITCSAMAKMNVTMRKGISREEIPIFSGYNCTTFHYKFAKSEYNFGVKNNIPQTTFNVYVYDFQPPLWIQISFSQYPKLNLKQFFITLGTALII